MGMDLIGNKPKSEKGDFFRNNVWYWRPLVDFICEKYPDIYEQCTYWGSNDGDGLNEEASKELATRIKQDIVLGLVAEYSKNHNEWRASLPREACNLCECTGIRNDDVGVENGMPTKQLSAEMKTLLGRNYGWCNGCDGMGTREAFIAGYPFCEDNVKEFAEFLENCGGFQIW